MPSSRARASTRSAAVGAGSKAGMALAGMPRRVAWAAMAPYAVAHRSSVAGDGSCADGRPEPGSRRAGGTKADAAGGTKADAAVGGGGGGGPGCAAPLPAWPPLRGGGTAELEDAQHMSLLLPAPLSGGGRMRACG
jgi:hypothetical protein